MTAMMVAAIMGLTIEPETAVPGDGLVRITVDVTDGDDVYWLITSPRSRDFEAIGNKLIFAAGAKPGRVEGDVTVINWDGHKYERSVWEVTIGSVPLPVPPVPPTPPLPPTVPQGLWGLTKVAHAESGKLDSRVIAQIGPLADNYAAVAELIVAMQITGIEDAKSELRKRNRLTVPVADRQYWAAWNTAIVAILASHNAELKASIDLVAEAYAAISDGLELTSRRTK